MKKAERSRRDSSSMCERTSYFPRDCPGMYRTHFVHKSQASFVGPRQRWQCVKPTRDSGQERVGIESLFRARMAGPPGRISNFLRGAAACAQARYRRARRCSMAVNDGGRCYTSASSRPGLRHHAYRRSSRSRARLSWGDALFFAYRIHRLCRQEENSDARTQNDRVRERAVNPSSRRLCVSTRGANTLTSPCYVCHAAKRQRPAESGATLAHLCRDGDKIR